MWEGEILKAFLLCQRFDIVSITLGNRSSGVARSSDGLVNVAWVVLHCNRRIGARERRQLIPHVRFQVQIRLHVWASVPRLCACYLNKRSCNFLFVARVVFLNGL